MLRIVAFQLGSASFPTILPSTLPSCGSPCGHLLRHEVLGVEDSAKVASQRLDPDGGRMGTPADIGNAVASLCSPDADWITGQLIYADGGASLADTLLPLEIQHG